MNREKMHDLLDLWLDLRMNVEDCGCANGDGCWYRLTEAQQREDRAKSLAEFFRDADYD